MCVYLKSLSFKRYQLDWICGLAILVYFFAVAEHARPFYRQFSLDDVTIQHPFAVTERVSGIACILISAIIPSVVIVAHVATSSNRLLMNTDQLHLVQVSILGLLLSLAISGTITDILKNWVARPRPDFLARCGPKEGTPHNQLVGIEVCTSPLGVPLLIDGMRSTPSGHSSISFSGMVYLTLWLFGQSQVLVRRRPIFLALLCCSPLLLASYIALSRTQDYRHHFVDIILGAMLGVTLASTVYRRYFNGIFSDESNKVAEEGDILPLH